MLISSSFSLPSKSFLMHFLFLLFKKRRKYYFNTLMIYYIFFLVFLFYFFLYILFASASHFNFAYVTLRYSSRALTASTNSSPFSFVFASSPFAFLDACMINSLVFKCKKSFEFSSPRFQPTFSFSSKTFFASSFISLLPFQPPFFFSFNLKFSLFSVVPPFYVFPLLYSEKHQYYISSLSPRRHFPSCLNISLNSNNSSYSPSIGLIKELRDKTAAGISNCKEALIETKGDLYKAERVLISKGKSIVKGANRNTKASAEGVIGGFCNEKKKRSFLIEVNCFSDFVAKNEKFNHSVTNLIELCEKNFKQIEEKKEHLSKNEYSIVEEIEKLQWEELMEKSTEERKEEKKEAENEPFKITIGEYMRNLSVIFGEEIKIRRFSTMNFSNRNLEEPLKNEEKKIEKEEKKNEVFEKEKVAINSEKADESKNQNQKTDFFLSMYLHDSLSHNLGKSGVLLAVKTNANENQKNLLREICNKICMHLIAAKPTVVKQENIPKEIIEKKKSEFEEDILLITKNEAKAKNIMQGKIKKFCKEIVLMEQEWMLDDTKNSVKKVLENFKNASKFFIEIVDFKIYLLQGKI